MIDGKSDFVVDEVQVFNGYVLHIGHLAEGEFKVGDQVVAGYDEVNPSLAFSLPSYLRADSTISLPL